MDIEKIIALPIDGEETGNGIHVRRTKTQVPPAPGRDLDDFADRMLSNLAPVLTRMLLEKRRSLIITCLDKAGNSFSFSFDDPPPVEETKSINDCLYLLNPAVIAFAARHDKYGMDSPIAEAIRATGKPVSKPYIFFGGTPSLSKVIVSVWCNACKEFHTVHDKTDDTGKSKSCAFISTLVHGVNG